MLKSAITRFRSLLSTPDAPPIPSKADEPAPAPTEAPRVTSRGVAAGEPSSDAPRRRRRRSRGGKARTGSEAGQPAEGAVRQGQGARQQAERTPSINGPVAVTGPQPRDQQFGSVSVSAPVAKALAEMGYHAPTPIQELVLGPMLAGEDIIGQAQTGTGKTAGFGIPIAEMADESLDHVQAMVLVPTRELAQQVTGELARITKYRGIRVTAVFGGQSINVQFKALAAGSHVVVGTPGRVIDHLGRGTLRIDRIRTIVLDEADQMLDIGFFPDIRRILRLTPRDRQTALFAATVPSAIRRLIYSYLREPKSFRIGAESEPVKEVQQRYCEVESRDKIEALQEVLADRLDEQTLVFCRTQEAVDRIVRIMKRKGYAIEGIHGAMRQSERNAVMQAFRDGRVRLLVSTNLTARGIDVPTVANVVNYDIPEQVEEYVHRIGRTARMGRPGTAFTFVSEWDMEFFGAIQDHIGAEGWERFELALYRRDAAPPKAASDG